MEKMKYIEKLEKELVEIYLKMAWLMEQTPKVSVDEHNKNMKKWRALNEDGKLLKKSAILLEKIR